MFQPFFYSHTNRHTRDLNATIGLCCYCQKTDKKGYDDDEEGGEGMLKGWLSEILLPQSQGY